MLCFVVPQLFLQFVSVNCVVKITFPKQVVFVGQWERLAGSAPLGPFLYKSQPLPCHFVVDITFPDN